MLLPRVFLPQGGSKVTGLVKWWLGSQPMWHHLDKIFLLLTFSQGYIKEEDGGVRTKPSSKYWVGNKTKCIMWPQHHPEVFLLNDMSVHNEHSMFWAVAAENVCSDMKVSLSVLRWNHASRENTVFSSWNFTIFEAQCQKWLHCQICKTNWPHSRCFFFFFINNTISPTCYSVVAGAVKNHKYGVFMPNHPKKSHTKLTPFFNVKMKQCSPAMNTKQTMLQSTKTITLIRCQSLRFICFLL